MRDEQIEFYNDQYFQRDVPETDFLKKKLLRPDQHAALCYALGFNNEKRLPRNPGYTVSVGCGAGFLEWELMEHANVLGLDIVDNRQYLIPFELGGLEAIPPCHTLIFCESIEHIPEDEWDAHWPAVKHAIKGGLLIITNWMDYHPIIKDKEGYDHVRTIDDAFYEKLSQEAKKVIHREGSHLVLQF